MPNENYPHADVADQDKASSQSQPDGTAAEDPRGETQSNRRSNQAIDPSAPTRGTEGGENQPQAAAGTNDGGMQNTGSDQNRYEAKGDTGEKSPGRDQEYGEAVNIGQDNHGLGQHLNPNPDSENERNSQSKVPTGKGGRNPDDGRPGKEGPSAERGAPESDMGRPDKSEGEKAA